MKINRGFQVKLEANVLAEVSRPHFDALAVALRARLNLGLGSGLRLALSLAAKSKDRAVLMGIAERFPKERELHLAILENKIAAEDTEVLSRIEHTCRERIIRLPFVIELMTRARDTTDMDELAGCVRNPLRVVRMTSRWNAKIGHLLFSANNPALSEAIEANRLASDAERARDYMKYLPSKHGSGERSIVRSADGRSISPVPPTTVRTPPAPTVSRQPTPPGQFQDLDALEGGVRAINLRRRPMPTTEPVAPRPLRPDELKRR